MANELEFEDYEDDVLGEFSDCDIRRKHTLAGHEVLPDEQHLTSLKRWIDRLPE